MWCKIAVSNCNRSMSDVYVIIYLFFFLDMQFPLSAAVWILVLLRSGECFGSPNMLASLLSFSVIK